MAANFTDRLKEYLGGEYKCPFCGSDELNYDSGEFGTEAHQEASCSSCGAEWLDVYKMSGIEVISHDDSVPESEVDNGLAMLGDHAMIPPKVLAALIGMAESHVEDIETGIEDGTYTRSENLDIDEKRKALNIAHEYLLKGKA